MPDPWLSVPHYKQERPHSCLQACVRMVLAYLGRTVSESALNLLFEAEDFGVPGHRLRRLTRWAYRVRYESGTEATLCSIFDQRVPVVALVRTGFLGYWTEDVYHAVVVVGMDASLVYLNDPWFDVAPQAVPRDGNCSGWPLEGAWHLQNSTENAEPACHKIVWNDQIQAKVPGT